jgi:hypothetical protein
MDIVENHRIKLLNAKCEVVCQAEYLMKKLQNGDDIECCTKKLFAAIKLINRLDCYCFPSPEININGEETFTVVNEIKFSGEFSLVSTVDRFYGFEYTTSGAENIEDIVNTMLLESGLAYTSVIDGEETVFTISTLCGKNELRIDFPGGSTLDSVVISEPVCVDAVTCNNCTTDADLSKYYQVLDNLLK